MADIGKTIEHGIIEAIASSAENLKEKLIGEAVARFEKELREAVGKVGISLANYYSIERLQNHLVIKVEIGSSEPK